MYKYTLSVISAILMGISQQPFGLGFLSWFSLFPFLFIIENQTNFKDIIKQSFVWSFIYHLIFFFWISDNIGLDSQILRYLIMLLVVLILTLNIFLIYGIYFYFKHKFNFSILILPFIIVAVEYIRSLGFYGSAWNSLSYTQIDYLIIAQNIEYTGIFGLTFWIVLINILILKVYRKINFNNLAILGLVFIFPWITGLIIKFNHEINGEKIRIKLIQPNISLEEKRRSLRGSLNKLIDLTQRQSIYKSNLVIWPESSISGSFYNKGYYNSRLSNKMNDYLKSSNSILVAGADLRIKNKRYNSAILFKKDSIVSFFNKQKLVPNVERTPDIFNLVGLNIGLTNFDIGSELTMFSINDNKFASMICIESVFPDLTRKFVNQGAEFITYIVNDGWYPRNPQLDQHAQRCIFRAIENRRYVARCANTGVTMVVDSYGNIIDKLEFNKEGVLESEIITSDKKTFYTKYGDVFSIFNILIIIFMLIISSIKNKNE
tara:strand:- start:2527 stop:3993 length:1467 start_codon:yes stop_codon:yes gene_type:complete